MELVLYSFLFPTILIIYFIYIIVSSYLLRASNILFPKKNIVDFNKMDAFSFDIDRLIEICRENDAAMVGVFGSVARGDDTPASDIDLMVKFSKRKSLLDIVKLERELSTQIGKKVDLLTEAAISPYLRDRILSELKVIYEN